MSINLGLAYFYRFIRPIYLPFKYEICIDHTERFVGSKTLGL